MGNEPPIKMEVSASPLGDIDCRGMTFKKGYEYIFDVLDRWTFNEIIYNESRLPIAQHNTTHLLVKWEHLEFMISSNYFNITYLI